MRYLSSVFLALLVSVLMLAFATATDIKGISPRPAEAASAVTVSVRCTSNPETTYVANNTNRAITIKRVGSIYQPYSSEPFYVGLRLRPNRAVTFESGAAADSNTLTRQYIYNNDVGRSEGARVATSIGRFVDRC